MYYTYILKSDKNGRYYIGSTENLHLRLADHNSGKVTSTKNKGPWKLLYSEKFLTRSLAIFREKEIKSYKGGNNFTKLLDKINLIERPV